MNNPELDFIKSRAMDSATEGITISDARLPDNPLIYINKGFSNMTGYEAREVIGKNCRFLQGQEKDQPGVKLIRKAINSRQKIQHEIINYKKDGTLFWNRLSITPVFNEANDLTHFIGVQEDITVQKEKEQLELKLANQELVTQITLIAEEKQRKEIGGELHDNINQLLATIKIYLNLALNDEEMREAMLKESQSTLIIAMDEIQKLSRSLVGININKETLEEALTQLIYSIGKAVPFIIEFKYNDDVEQNLSESRKLMFYRLIQEQLNNIIKHAGPKLVCINFWKEKTGIWFSIKDNGIGFDPGKKGPGIGLKNMQNRVGIESGSLSIITAEKKGCEIKVFLPDEPGNQLHILK